MKEAKQSQNHKTVPCCDYFALACRCNQIQTLEATEEKNKIVHRQNQIITDRDT